MLGGSSRLNYMIYLRGHPRDFDSWISDNCEHWTSDEILAYFKKSENQKGRFINDGKIRRIICSLNIMGQLDIFVCFSNVRLLFSSGMCVTDSYCKATWTPFTHNLLSNLLDFLINLIEPFISPFYCTSYRLQSNAQLLPQVHAELHTGGRIRCSQFKNKIS